MAYKIDGLCVPVEFLVMGALQNNVYLVGGSDAGSVVVVDPCCQAERIVEALDGRSVEAIVITHCHWDHVGAAADLRSLTGAPVIASAIDAPVISGEKKLDPTHTPFDPCPVDRTVDDGDTLELGGMPWKVLLTPGHTPGGICLFLDAANGADPAGFSVLVSGDTLFCGSIGRTDFVGGSMDDMRASLRALAQLPDNTAVLPGHDRPTTIGAERSRVFALYA